jgi:thymidylate synthase (FAD)
MDVRLKAITPDPEIIIAEAARTCYDSFGKQSEESDARLIKHLLKSGHHSVFEHAVATFLISGISRACSHQLVRHRLAAYSQRSQRYVKETGFEYVTPPWIEIEGMSEFYDDIMADLQSAYSNLIGAGVKPEDARFVLPNACCTEIVMTANFREWRHIISLRGLNIKAQWEINEMAKQILRILALHAPLIFEDQVKEAAKQL